MIELIKGDCLVEMQNIPDKSIDMICADLPYGTTACKWDTIIPFEPLWAQYKRIIKDNGAIVLFGSQPFTSALVMSNVKMFRYEWIYSKSVCTGFMNGNKMPMKQHENILVFYSKLPTYNPQMVEVGIKDKRKTFNPSSLNKNGIYSSAGKIATNVFKKKDTGFQLPKTIQHFNNPNNNLVHPTQKPVPLLEYLIKTYTNEGETVLDNTCGSGTTGVACVNTNRNFIGIEMDEAYFEIASKRINEAQTDLKLKL